MTLSTLSTIPINHKAVAFTGLEVPLTEIVTTKTLTPSEDQLLVKVYSNALNPTDYKHFLYGWGKHGCVLGTDSSGVVVKVGSKVNDFEVGDFVSSFTHGGYSPAPTDGSFQEFAIVPTSCTLKYPELKLLENATQNVSSGKVDSFEAASSINLGLATVGMSFIYQFKLKVSEDYSMCWMLIWGGATATGMIAIQVAKKIFNCKVITTASLKHENLLKKLGADIVLDYNDDKVISKIKKLSDDTIKYALDTVSNESTLNLAHDALSDELSHCYLDNLLALSPNILKKKKKNVRISGTLVYLISGEDENLNGMTIESNHEIVECHNTFWKIANKFVIEGKILHAPLTILSDGMNSVNEGLEMLKLGKISGEKLVFRIDDTK